MEEYRRSQEHQGDGPGEPIVPSGERRRSRSPSSGPSRGYMIAVVSILAVIVLLVVLLVTSSGSKSPTAAPPTPPPAGTRARTAPRPPPSGTRPRDVALSLHASSVVYVCLLGDGGRKLIPGLELQAGQTTPTYHARRFEVTLGNSDVTMVIDGRPRTVPASSEAIGYSVTRARGRHSLAAASRPTCK